MQQGQGGDRRPFLFPPGTVVPWGHLKPTLFTMTNIKLPDCKARCPRNYDRRYHAARAQRLAVHVSATPQRSTYGTVQAH
jgi:hypothetical protein